MAPRGRGKDRAAAARPFVFAHTTRGWRVKQGDTDAKSNWRHAREICCSAPTITMPNGDIVGIGVVQRDGDVIRITA